MVNNNERLVDVLKSLYAHRRLIRNVCLFTLLGSLVIAFLLPNYYQSTTIFYPTSPQLANPELLFGSSGQVTQYYGNDNDLDRLLEIASGNELADFMIDSFKLYEHYDIDPNSVEGPYKVRKKFRKLYHVEKNKFDAIEISIEDTDRELAAKMINAARVKIDQIGQRLTKDSQRKLLDAFERNISGKEKTILVLNDSIEVLKNKYGIYDIGSQGEQLSEISSTSRAFVAQYRAKLQSLEKEPSIPRDTIAYVRAQLRGYESQLASLKTDDDFNVHKFNKGAQEVSVLQDLHFQARKQLSYDLERYKQIMATYSTDIPSLLVTQPGEVPRIKSRPKRSVLIITAVLAAFIFTTIGILLKDSYKDVDWKRITSDERG